MGNARKARNTVILLLGCLLLAGCSVENEYQNGAKANNTVIAFVQQAKAETSIWKGWGAQLLNEDTGLTLELYSSGTHVEEKLKQYMVAGASLDIIGFQDINQAKLYIDTGLLLPLNEYKELLPAVFQDDYETALTYSQEYLSGNKGDLLLLPVSVGPSLGVGYKTVPMLQSAAYRKAGEPTLKTMEDYLDAVEQMLKESPVNSVGERMLGISLYQDDQGIAVHTAALAYLYGIDMYSVSPLMETDMGTRRIASVFAEGSFYKRALHFYNEANRRGILDPDSLNQTESSLERKIKSGRVMMVLDMDIAEKYNDILAGYSTGFLEGYRVVAADDLKLYRDPDYIVGKNQYFAVHKNSPNVEGACRLLNWLYEEETQFQLYNGPEGVIWERDADGHPHFTEQGLRILNSDGPLPGYQGTLEDGIKPFGELGRSPASLTAQGYALSCRFWDNQGYGESLSDAVMETASVQATTAIYMVDPVPGDLNKKIEEIRQMADGISRNMIYAQTGEEFEALWLSMVSQAQQLGMAEVEEFYTQAWEKAKRLAGRYEEVR